MRWKIAAVAALALVGGGTWLALAQTGDALPGYRDPQVIAQGVALYDAHCAACHGADLEGQPDWRSRDADGYLPAPPHDATGHTWHHSDAVLLHITRVGSAAAVGGGYLSRMPGFSDTLTDPQIRAILSYIKSTWPDRVIEHHNRLNAAEG
ncbi:MAG: cytochrome c [Rhodobacteraceae bacterium]|nr:cytochrome c [Paracoccaceae bacterium]